MVQTFESDMNTLSWMFCQKKNKNYPQQLAPESRTKKIGCDKLKDSIEELGAKTT